MKPKLRTGARACAILAGLALALTACGSSHSSSPTITIAPARVYQLAGFRPSGPVPAGRPVRLAFTIQQPSGAALTTYKRGPGPHTGVHLIIVRSDLATIIHHHPPVDPRTGRIADTVVFPLPGRYRVVIDAYPKTSGPQPNFQLFDWITVSGRYRRQPLPPFRPTVSVDGYRFSMGSQPKLVAISAQEITVHVTTPSGKPAVFTPWYGALAHAIFFRRGTLDYFHTHICAPNATGCTSILAGTKVTGRSSRPGILNVGVLVPAPGTWRLFLQCKLAGHVLTAPFTLHVS